MEHFEILSVWEVAHCWHDVDQDSTDPENLPLPVKDTLRELMYALDAYLNAYDAQGELIPCEYLGLGLRPTKFAKQLKRDLNAGVLDKKFLRATFVRRDELPKWFPDRGIPLPAFWYPESVARATEQPRREEGPIDPTSDYAKRKASAKARKAALKRHEPVQRIKEDLFLFWDSGHFPSQAEAVRRFLKSRSEELLRPLSRNNRSRTLGEALSKHVKSKRKG